MSSEPVPPVEQAGRALAWRIAAVVFLALFVLGLYLFRKYNPNHPVVYSRIDDHFKYGSIGGEPVDGIPYWIWRVLPEMFPEKLPGRGYESLGFLYEPGRELPIGLSLRKVLIDRVGLNCAVCHTSTVRDAPGAAPRIILGMPANGFDLQRYFRFLTACVLDGRFSVPNVLAAIQRHVRLGLVERLIYREAIWQTREALLERKRLVSFMDSRPDWGPGRVDTFNPYKTLYFGFMMESDHTIGTTDLPSIWNQKPRLGMHLHWDGNNASLEERNKSAALGAGVRPATLDLRSLTRIEAWLRDGLHAPPYPYAVDRVQAARGAALYKLHCAECHDFGGKLTGHITRIDIIRTDSSRLDSFTPQLALRMNTLGEGYPWKFRHFEKTGGYANMPLDGLWLRAPYLHNGSVPTLRDLLEPPENRPRVFYRGCDLYDPKNGGFVSNLPREGARRYFRYDVSLPGNGNGGHLYGTDLEPPDKEALLEYLKTL